MRNLNYELKKLCLRNSDGSYATQYARERILTQVANQLYELGFRDLQVKSLKPKHVQALVERGAIHRRPRLGGMLNFYYRQAA